MTTNGSVDGALRINIPGYFWGQATSAAAFGQLGKRERAQKAVKELLVIRPDFAGAARGRELVTFSDAGNPIGTGTISSGAATFTTSSLKAGWHRITATYGGDATLAGSVSPAILQIVVPDSTKTVLASSLNPAPSGQAVTFTATVAGTGPFAPTGTITFRSRLSTLATVPINNGAASYTTGVLRVGSNFITATYNGDSNNLRSVSPVLTETVGCLAKPVGVKTSLSLRGMR